MQKFKFKKKEEKKKGKPHRTTKGPIQRQNDIKETESVI